MREQELLAVRADQKVRDQDVAGIIRHLRQLANQRQRKALADDGCGTQRRAVALRQTVHPRQHQARQRCGESILALVRRAHQLLQEQRIAARTLDTLLGKRGRRRQESAGQRQRVLGAERAEIDRDERTPLHRSAPSGVERIAGDARGERKDGRHCPDATRQRGDIVERYLVGPMHVLDDHEHRSIRARRPEQTNDCGGPAPLARRVVHRRIQRVAVRRLRQTEEVAQKRLVARKRRVPRQ